MKRKLWIILALATLIALLCCGTVQAIMVEPDDNTCMYGGAHTWGEWHTDKEATCTESGEQSRQCNICLYQQVQSIQALGHNFQEIITRQPTCTEEGWAIERCTRCEAVKDNGHPVGSLGHDFQKYQDTKAPTCAEAGERTYYCGRCPATKTETIPALGHIWDGGKMTTAASCTQEGVKTYTCTRDSSHTYTEPIAKTAHTPVTVPGKAATCTETGLTDGSKCSVCGTVLTAQETIPANGHTPVTVPGKAPTCTETGLTDGSKCSVCGAVLTAQETIPAKGHMPVTVPGKAATCTEAGLADGSKCSVCGTVLTAQNTIPASGHTPVTVPGKAATCTEAGLTDGSKCSVCGTVLTAQSAIPAKGHNYQVTASKEPTATEDGYRTYTCSNCKDSYTETLPKTAHTHNYQVTAQKAATCTEQDSKTYTCSICGNSYTENSPALGHSWGPWQPGTAATCVKYGTRYHDCSRCGEREWARDYSALGDHVWGEWTQVKAPTATEPGLEERVCQNDASHKEQREIPPMGDVSPAALPAAGGEATPEKKAELKGATITYTGFNKGEPPYWAGEDGSSSCNLTFWDTTAPLGEFETRSLCTDPGENQSLTEPPVSGETYYFSVEIMDTKDAPIDFSKVDPALLLCTWEPFSVSYRNHSTYEDSGINHLKVQFAATYTEKDDGPNPGLSLTVTWADDAGVGKRYKGETIPTRWTITNTGNCTVYKEDFRVSYIVDKVWPNGITYVPELGYETAAINPGQSFSFTALERVSANDVEKGSHTVDEWGYAYYFKADNNLEKVYTNYFLVDIPLTYSEGEEPEAPNASLSASWLYDCAGSSTSQYPTSQNTFDADDKVYAKFICTNAGETPLLIDAHVQCGNGKSWDMRINAGDINTVFYFSWSDCGVNPGQTIFGWCGNKTIGDIIDPGSETDELLGTVTFTAYFVGYDPVAFRDEGYSAPELCRSETVTHTVKVRKPGPAAWEIPEESAVSLEHSIDTKWDPPADPAGYQLGEWWSTWLKATNTGTVTIPSKSVTVYDPWDGFTTQINSDWKPGETHNYIWDIDCVSEEDVARGYIYLPPLQFTWTDPDSGNEKTAYSNPLTLPVISKTGLLVTKGIAHGPANGSYFQAGEQIDWTLTVTNNSQEPIRNVVVTDQGVTVGSFAEIAPGETKTCAVPPHTVTEYEALAVGYVSNMAKAVGTNLKGAELTYNSNLVSVPTNDHSPVPLPPTGDPKGDPEGDPLPGSIPPGAPETPTHPGTPGGGEDPLGPVYGVNVGATIYKTTAHGPANGDWFALGENIDYIITVKNIGDVALENVTVIDSLGGFAPIGTAGSIAPGAEQSFTYQHKVTQSDIDKGYVMNSAVASYAFNGGIPATPIKSNPVYSKAGENGYIPGEGVPGLYPTDDGHFDPTLLPAPGPGYTPVTGPDGTPVTTPDGKPIYTDGHGGYSIVGPDGHLVVTDEHGKPILSPAGGYIYPDGEGGYCIAGPDGGYIKCDEKGNPILDENGNYIYVDGLWPISCEARLDSMGDSEMHYTLHACAEHTGAALAAEAASAAGTAEGWKQAGDIWREEIDKLYQTLFDAADDEAKAALINDRANLYAYVATYQAMRAGEDPAEVEQAVAELLRLRCAELCAMAHTMPAQLPDSLLGNYARMIGGESYDISSREIGPLAGSDSEMTERYDAAFARTLGDVLDTVRGTVSAGRANAFIQAQRQWQMALDGKVNAVYKAASREDRKLIAGWRIMLDQVYAARTEMLDMLYGAAPEVGEEVLMNLYKNAALDAAER